MTSHRGRLTNLPLRFRLLEIGLFLPVLVTAALSLAYLRAFTARQRALEAAGDQLARRISERALVEASRRGDEAARSLLDPVHRVRPPTADRVFAAMRQAADSLRACRCGPLKEGSFYFYWVPATGEFHSTAPVPRVADPRRLPRSLPAGYPRNSIWAAGAVGPQGFWLLHYTRLPLADGAEALVGFDISIESWWAGTIGPAVKVAERQHFPMLADADTALRAALTAGGTELIHTGGRYDGPSATTTLLTGLGVDLVLTLNPSLLPGLLSAAAPPAYPLLIGALGASLLLSALALLLLRQLRRTIARRGAFVASISHELRTPLTEVLLHAESLHLDRDTPEAKARAAGAIVRETRRLIGLVENALTYAGAGRTRERPPPGLLGAAAVVRESLRSLEPAMTQREARVILTLDEAAACPIDSASLDRIVSNLVENALRYGPPGQTIRVVLGRENGSVSLTVDDEGPGIPPAEHTRIWDPFERGAAAEGSAGTGVGLGLAIVRHLAEQAGGTATAAGAPSGGARFVVTLPAVSGEE